MRAPYFVEILTRHNEVRYRQRVDELPVRIGRGYDNDVILDDPHISAHHAVVEQQADGGVLIRDLASRNGIIHKGRRQTELPIDGNTILRLGHTNLRVRSFDFPVDDERADTTLHSWEGWPPALAGLVLIVGLSVADTWLDDFEKFEAIRYLMAVAIALCLGMVWCGIWSFAGRLFGGNARLGRHLFILGCGLAAMELWNFVSGAAAYAFSLEMFTRYGSHLTIAVTAGMVYFHLLQIKPHRARAFVVTSVLLALVGSGLKLMTNYSSNGFPADELYMHVRMPPAFRFSADKPVSRLISDAEKLKARVDEERTKPVSGVWEPVDYQEIDGGME